MWSKERPLNYTNPSLRQYEHPHAVTVHRDPEDRDQGLDTSAWLQSSKYQGSRSLSGPQECGSLFLPSGWTLGSGLSSIP